MNTGILSFLDYAEDIYTRVLSVLVSIINPNCSVFTTSNKFYFVYNKGLSVPVSILNPKPYVISTTNTV